jgi:hypothetical protein
MKVSAPIVIIQKIGLQWFLIMPDLQIVFLVIQLLRHLTTMADNVQGAIQHLPGRELFLIIPV